MKINISAANLIEAEQFNELMEVKTMAPRPGAML